MPVAVSGKDIAFIFYRSGILDESVSCPIELNHTLPIVGYGIEETVTVL